MLFYKAWLESRVRFLSSAAVLSSYCFSFVRQARFNFPPVLEPSLPYSAYVWRGIYNGLDTLLFVIVAVLLGLGGLERERAAGAAGFTLSLPVTRLQLLVPRAMVAVLETALLAAIPLAVVPWTSVGIGRPYPFEQAAPFAFLFAVTGAVWACLGFLWSVTLSGEHTAAVAGILTPILYAAVCAGTILRRYPALNLFNLMNGSRLPFLDERTAVVTGPLPWTMLGAVVLVGAGLVAAAALVTTRRDF
jgi:ABC-2 type transport system permease protein